jgi:hypothetical protein
MCINNATQIAINQGIKDNLGEQIEQIARELMEVAVNGLIRWEQGEHEKDQNSSPNEVEEKPKDDLPF